MKAFDIKKTAHVYVYSEPVNMGKAFDGLQELVRTKLKKKPENGDLYVFVNRRATYIKILFWSNYGYCIFAKRLEAGRFDFVAGETIDIKKMQYLVDEVTAINNNKLAA